MEDFMSIKGAVQLFILLLLLGSWYAYYVKVELNQQLFPGLGF